jgi:cob(I)alamin adenosyltransferase
VVRRAERHALAAAEPPSLVVPYLNRLSDLLWTMARWQESQTGSTRTARSLADAAPSAAGSSSAPSHSTDLQEPTS